VIFFIITINLFPIVSHLISIYNGGNQLCNHIWIDYVSIFGYLLADFGVYYIYKAKPFNFDEFLEYSEIKIRNKEVKIYVIYVTPLPIIGGILYQLPFIIIVLSNTGVIFWFIAIIFIFSSPYKAIYLILRYNEIF
jgi:hypothetical protein